MWLPTADYFLGKCVRPRHPSGVGQAESFTRLPTARDCRRDTDHERRCWRRFSAGRLTGPTRVRRVRYRRRRRALTSNTYAVPKEYWALLQSSDFQCVLHRAPTDSVLALDLATGSPGPRSAAYGRVQLNPRVRWHQHPRIRPPLSSQGRRSGRGRIRRML
jgi:hypothetical protein